MASTDADAITIAVHEWLGVPPPTAADAPWLLTRTIVVTQPANVAAPFVDAGRVVTSPPDFGTDLGSYPSLDFRPRNTRRNVADALYRRLTTPRGKYRAHPDYGFDLRSFLGQEITDDVLLDVKTTIEREAEKDERVAELRATVRYDPTTFAVTVRMEIETADGPFAMVLSVTALSVDMLFQDRG